MTKATRPQGGGVGEGVAVEGGDPTAELVMGQLDDAAWREHLAARGETPRRTETGEAPG